TLYTSGTVFHAFLGEKLPDWKAAANLVRKIAENYKLPYYTMSPTYSVCRDHGYLTGEQYTCPICGQKTEVYSRITGYYRPVQNWNDGKVQEFKDRKVYNIGRSVLTHTGPRPTLADAAIEAAFETPCCAPAEPMTAPDAEAPAQETARADGGVLLFKTPTCPNCKAAMALLDKAGIAYQALNANEEKELVEKYEVKQAPTLVLVGDNGYEKFRGVSDIKGWLMQQKA
ncbi:MAG: ribonucleoside triphosphate reductase, partial [Clostridiales bacterium]|nr:ribonucleoside triphosphate reductase [Clostridiales bacterium]